MRFVKYSGLIEYFFTFNKSIDFFLHFNFRNFKFHSFVCLLHLLYLPIFKSIVGVNCEVNEKIIIIGAGPSGIAAASKLIENGFTNITILEAENRIGGRLYTTKLGNCIITI